MKITKLRLKKIILEEIEKISEDNRKQKTIIITPKQFLDLTTTPKIMSELEKRFENLSYDPFKISKESPYLTLDHNGKVLSHEGRLRAFILNKQNINNYEIDINYPSSLNINKNNLMLFNQFDEEKSITINKDQNNKEINISQLNSIDNVQQSTLSGIFREIISNLIKQNNMSRQDAINLLNEELQNYDVVLNPPKEGEYSIICTISPMISARIYKTNFDPQSKLNNPTSTLFQNPISWKDKISLRKKK